MTLSQINKDEIILNFKSISNFNNEIDKCIRFTDGYERIILNNIKIYYNNLFYNDDVCLVSDLLTHTDLVKNTIYCLKNLNRKKPCFIYNYLYNRFSKNIDYVIGIKKLA